VDTWVSGIAAITLFVEDLDEAKHFYEDVFELPVHFEDADSAAFKFGATLINLLRRDEAPDLIAPATVGDRDSGHRFQFTIGVDDVDAACERLRSKGVQLLNGPMDRAWGVRTVSFEDPAGHIWELAQ
jgi:lactoylglutathione lyase